jgi:hypothetical protein
MNIQMLQESAISPNPELKDSFITPKRPWAEIHFLTILVSRNICKAGFFPFG